MSIFDRLNGGSQQTQLQQVMQNPIGMGQQAGYKIPENLAGNPQAMVMHLIQTGQVSNPLLQKIMPMMQRMGIK